jgi:hypothetical protein
MPTCSETYGQGWVGEYPNCTYEGFSGTVDSLGYGTVLEGSTLEDDWQKYFDPYDVTKEDLLTATAGIDVGQLKTAWGLKGKQLGEVWGAKTSELEGTADIARKGANVAYSGTIETGLKKGLKAGESVYKQAIETGRLGLEQATTDIYQGLGADIYAERTDWKEDQRDTLNMLLGSDIWPEDEENANSVVDPLTCEQQGMQTCPDGTCAPWDSTCAGQGEDENPCSLGQTQCPDGTCVWVDDSPGDPCEGHGG